MSPTLGFSFLLEVTGCCSSCFSSFTPVCLCYTHPPAHPAHPILGFLSSQASHQSPFIHKPVESRSQDDAGGKRIQDSRQNDSQATYFLHRNSACKEPRLLGRGVGGDLGHQNRVSMKAPRLRGNLLVLGRTNQRREREKPCIGWGWPRLQRECKERDRCARSGFGPTVTSLGILV